jgi:DNA-binding CsgD family transcriptional regulator
VTDLFSRAAALEKLDDIDAIWAGATDALRGVGFEFFNYLTVTRTMQDPFLLTNVPQIYGDQDPAQDPFLGHCCDSYDITLTGPAYLADYDYLPDAAKQFISAARNTGFETGLGIPLRLRGSARFGGFNIGTRLDRTAFEADIVPMKETLRLFCLIIHRRFEELQDVQTTLIEADFRTRLMAPERDTIDLLTAREQEVAYLVASGLSRKECARMCEISPYTVSEHVKSIYRKLGVNDRVKLARLFEDTGAA